MFRRQIIAEDPFLRSFTQFRYYICFPMSSFRFLASVTVWVTTIILLIHFVPLYFYIKHLILLKVPILSTAHIYVEKTISIKVLYDQSILSDCSSKEISCEDLYIHQALFSGLKAS
jgi:hypothetical protein